MVSRCAITPITHTHQYVLPGHAVTETVYILFVQNYAKKRQCMVIISGKLEQVLSWKKAEFTKNAFPENVLYTQCHKYVQENR